jgi:hypothetical protein
MITQKNFWFVFGDVWLGIGVVFAVIGAALLWQQWSLDQRIARGSATAEGIVLAKSMTRRKDGDPTFKVDWLWLAGVAGWVVRIALVLAAIAVAGVIGELAPPLKELDSWMTDQRLPLMYITGTAAALGVFLLIGAVISLLMERGAPLDHTGVEIQQWSMRDARMGPRVWRKSMYRVFGPAAGASADDEFSFAELKGAFRSGAILREGQWRRRLCAICGAALMLFGIFGVAIVLSPLALKLLLAAAVVYVMVRVAWGLVRA